LGGSSDEKVMRDIGGKTLSCLEQKKYKLYSATVEEIDMISENEDFYVDSMNSQFIFRFSSNKRHVYEEVLILDETGLIGSLGGSLGLFIGFSFFGYAMPLLEALFDQVVDFFQQRYQIQEVHTS
jgi:hypothetical protein